MNQPNKHIEDLLKKTHDFTGIADFVPIHLVPISQFQEIKADDKVIYARQFEQFFRYSYKQK